MKVLNSDRYYLKGTNKRFLHMASVEDGFREYMCFFDMHEKRMYIEEVSGGTLAFIEDDKLVEDIKAFLEEKNILNMKYGLPWPDEE